MKRVTYAGLRAFSALQRFLHERLTPAGWIAFTGALAAAAVGVDTNRSMSYQLAGFVAALLGMAFASTLALRARVSARRELPRYATAGEPFEYRVVLQNRGRRPLRGAALGEWLRDPRPSFAEWRDTREPGEERRNWFDRTQGYFRWRWLIERRLPERPQEAIVEPIGPGASLAVTLSLRPRRRGRMELAGLTLARGEPLGLARGLTRVPLEGRVIALPRRYRLPAIALPGRRRFQQGGVSHAVTVGDSTEFIGLREYRPGDPLHKIDWKSTARSGVPIVKEYQDEFYERHALVLDTSSARGEDDCFEEAVAVAASFVYAIDTRECLLDLLFVGGEVRTYTAGRGQLHTEHMLEVLAGVGPSRPEEFSALTAAVLGQRPALSSCIVVTASWDEERRAFVEALRGSGLEVRALLVSDEPIVAPNLFVLRPGQIEAGLARLQ
ncbi:MAG TPA: DUF58 domain-containing protein [Burkholderiales bacterium]|nr:DUF58 domain-containing protein [Burkholderiales bacterium]